MEVTENPTTNATDNTIIILISILNNGTVKFGPFNTEDGQFKKRFRKGKNINLKATPEKGFQFLNWLHRIKKDEDFSFLSSNLSITIKAPDRSREIRAVFGQPD